MISQAMKNWLGCSVTATVHITRLLNQPTHSTPLEEKGPDISSRRMRVSYGASAFVSHLIVFVTGSWYSISNLT
jgi:hypothetical protein